MGALAIVALAALAAPPGPRTTRTATFTIAPAASARGVVHVHTTRSDGSGTVDEVAAAAARAGLRFVVVTDHGDGTRPPLAPAYRSGVLVIDGVEISTTHGHYLALGLGQAPYRLAGDAADVVEDVRRLGGFGVVAHPDSPKPALSWRDWQAPVDGLEWFNLDSEWRDDSSLRLARALVYYPIRPVPSLALLADDGGSMLPRWAAMAAQRRVIGLASVDAHARLGSEGGFDRAWVSLRAPGYETLFATAQVSVELDAALSGDAGRDAAAVLGALRDGRTFSTIAARAAAGRVAIVAERGGVRARMGEFLPGTGPVVDHRRSRRAARRGDPHRLRRPDHHADLRVPDVQPRPRPGRGRPRVSGGRRLARFVAGSVRDLGGHQPDLPAGRGSAGNVGARRRDADAIGGARGGGGRVARRARGQRRGAARAGRRRRRACR